MKKTKVLMTAVTLGLDSGVNTFIMNYLRQMDHTSIQVDVVVYKKSVVVNTAYFEEIKKFGGNVFFLPSVKKLFKHIRACNEILKNGNYNIIHNNSMLVTYPLMKLAKKFVSVRILHSHSSRLGGTKKKERRNAFFLPLLLKQANAYAACSDLAAKAMFGDAGYKLIPNIIDADYYHFDPVIRKQKRAELNVEGKKIIATVARVAEEKNPFFAMDVFDIVAENESAAEYWWIGSGALDQKVEKYKKTLKHGDRIKLLGSRTDVQDLYQAADLFFLPSLFEGLPLTGIEAQAMGLPCVISDSVTKDVVYTDLVEFVSLQKSKKHWADVLCSKLDNQVRTDRSNDLLNSRFAAQNAGTFLENYYRELIHNQLDEE